MKSLSFRDYVLNHSPEDSAAGDFIRDSQHQRASFPDPKSWKELENWLESHGAIEGAIQAAENVWERYQVAKSPIAVRLARGYTVQDLIDLLQKEDPDAHVIKLHVGDAKTSRVEGFSRVTILNGGKLTQAVMLE